VSKKNKKANDRLVWKRETKAIDVVDSTRWILVRMPPWGEEGRVRPPSCPDKKIDRPEEGLQEQIDAFSLTITCVFFFFREEGKKRKSRLWFE